MIESVLMGIRRRIANRSGAVSVTCVRRVRLHAELLEGRLFMAADAASAGDLLPSSSATLNGDNSPVVVATMTTSAATASIAAASTLAEEGWETFGSRAAFEDWLIEAVIAQYGSLFGQRTYGGWDASRHLIDLDFPILFGSDVQTNSAYSSTNLQEAGVDEADLIETDGFYLYILSGDDLVIVQAGVGEELKVVSRVHIGGRLVGMYLSGDRLAIVSDKLQYCGMGSGTGLIGLTDAMYGYHQSPSKTTVTVLDISDRSDVSQVQKSEMDGQLIASRVVDGELRLVIGNHFRLPPPNSRPISSDAPPAPDDSLFRILPAFTPFDRWYPIEDWQERVYETQEEYFARVRDTILEAVLPHIRQLGVDGEVFSDQLLVDPTRLYRPHGMSDLSITTIATFDLASDLRGPVATESVFTREVPQVYATEDSLYLFAQKEFVWTSAANRYTQATRIWKFDFGGGQNGIKLAARGTVVGLILNQFAIDEENGFLRVVTQSWATSGHGLHVLKQVGRRLEVVGSVDGIATNEQLYSVRFIGNRGYFVTFRQVDPLFVVDLSDPTNPELLGELHVPGYSDYLQPIDENHLLAIGRGANEANGNFEELQVSIFDVSDPANPRLLHRYSFEGGRETATPATGDRWTRGDGDHHAVGYYHDKQVLALPVFRTENWMRTTGSVFSTEDGGLHVFKVDPETGFTPLGVIEHDTLVTRSVRIGDRLYAISSGAVSVHELEDPTAKLGEVSIADPSPPVSSPWIPSYLASPFVVETRFLLEPELELLPEKGNQLAAVWEEPVTLQATPESDSSPQVGWAPASHALVKRAQSTLSSASTPRGAIASLDAKLLDLLRRRAQRTQPTAITPSRSLQMGTRHARLRNACQVK